jgi:hypothetical protein
MVGHKVKNIAEGEVKEVKEIEEAEEVKEGPPPPGCLRNSVIAKGLGGILLKQCDSIGFIRGREAIGG